MEILRNLKLIQALNGKHGFIKLAGGGSFITSSGGLLLSCKVIKAL